MATTYVPKFLKRTASQAQLENPVAKKSAPEPQLQLDQSPAKAQVKTPVKQSQPLPAQPSTFKFARLKWDLQRRQRRNGSFLDEKGVQSLLVRSIGSALQAVGFERAEPEALEAFREDVEEYMLRYLASIKRSMLACRRIQALPQDFLQALHEQQLSLRALLPHLDPPIRPSKSQFAISLDNRTTVEDKETRLIETLVNTSANNEAKSYIPRHFPQLPSRHTYKETPEFLHRDYDPRKIRERAAEEGRLGEEALRRLVGAASQARAAEASKAKKQKNVHETRDSMWRKTMEAFGQKMARPASPDGDLLMVDSDEQERGAGGSAWTGHLGSVVNAEKRYWRKPKKP